ncbi:MAG TPA: MerR family transcriptional regulator [Chromatiales bacterium]|nr:MerR family transcriptional regulator [Chromatiales bacterium]HEX22996.1 MerR family transcriptional regulator [Chromatiales bacterium]
MLTVSELSKVAQATPDAIRHYVRIGLLTPSRNPDNGYKLFNGYDIKKVKFICRAKGLGFTLSDIQIIFDHSSAGKSPCPAVRDIIQQRINENRDRLVELNRLQQRMDEALEKWKSMPDGEPDGNAICYLIESTH